MLKDRDVAATIAVSDLAAARKFYEGTLGLELVAREGDEALTFRTGSARLLVYRSQYAGTNRATAATWFVGDELDDVVRALREKGVKFEHYDMPGARLEGNVHVFGEHKNAWFKDPEGNVISVVNGLPVESRVG